MQNGNTPRWLDRAERKLGWLAIPRIAVLVVTMQAAGFLMVSSDTAWIERLALIPSAVSQEHQFWRLITWLALPLTLQPIWVIFTLWFLWFIINAIEDQWGSFKTTFYILFSMIVTIVYSMLTGYPILQAGHFQSTLFWAAAALLPDFQILLFFVVPVKLKWLAYLTLVFLGMDFAQSGWYARFHLLSMLSGYILFFGPAALQQARMAVRRRQYKNKLRR